LTSVTDTRLLVFLEFPPNQEIKAKTRDFFEKELRGHLLAPSIVLTEFIEVAGSKIGEEAAKTKIRLLQDRGMQTVVFDEKQAFAAGSLLLSHRNVPIADVIIASFVKTEIAEYVLTDDTHFNALGVKTKWMPK
jgi:predicted nucleic acid-binding protein